VKILIVLQIELLPTIPIALILSLQVYRTRPLTTTP
jgi:hypothetical protein